MRNTFWDVEFLLDLDGPGFDGAGDAHLRLCKVAEVEFFVEDGEDADFGSDGDLGAFCNVLLEGTRDFDLVCAAVVVLDQLCGCAVYLKVCCEGRVEEGRDGGLTGQEGCDPRREIRRGGRRPGYRRSCMSMGGSC